MMQEATSFLEQVIILSVKQRQSFPLKLKSKALRKGQKVRYNAKQGDESVRKARKGSMRIKTLSEL